jgi:hypothetical protein
MQPSDALFGRTAASIDAAKYATGSGTRNPPPSVLAPRSMLRGLTGLLRDLELDRSLSLLLHDGGSRGYVASVTVVLHLQSRKVARSKLAIDCEIEHCEFPDVRRHLQSRSDCPNCSEL